MTTFSCKNSTKIGVVERKNIPVQVIERNMLLDAKLPNNFWTK